MNAATQSSLFDSDHLLDDRQAVSARARMRAMIDRARAASVPYWHREIDVILDDGSFQRALRLVPTEEAQGLWVEYNAQIDRLYAIWAAADPSRVEGTPEV